MPIFEVEVNGQAYEVDAPDEATALAAVQQPAQQAAAPAQPPTMDQAYQSQTRAAEAQGQVGPELLSRAAMRLPEGAGQLVLRGAAAVTDKAKPYYERYNEVVTQNRAASEAKAPGVNAAADVLSSAIPAGGAAGAVGRGVGYLRSLARASSVGAVFGSTMFAKDDQERLLNTSVNAAFPLATQALVGPVGATRNFVVRSLEAADSSPRVQAVRAAASEFFRGSQAVPEPLPYTIGQQTGSPILQKLEARAAGKVAQAYLARQSDQAAARFDEIARQAEQRAQMPATSPEIVSRTNRTVDVLDMQLRREKNRAFVEGMNEVAALPGASERFRLTNLEQEFNSIMQEADNPFNIKGNQLPPAFRRVQDAIRGRSNDGVQVLELQRLMAGLGQDRPRGQAILSEADRQLEAYRSRLFTALNQDVDSLGAPSQALERLQQVRQRYAQQSEALRRLEDSNINRLFGSQEAFANPAATLQRFYGLAPEDQRFAVDILERRAPDVLRAMQAHRLTSALDAATEAGPAQQARLNISKFTSDLFGGRDGLKGSQLWNGRTRQQVLQGAAHLSMIQNSVPRSAAAPAWPEEISINLVSRSAAFMARLATRIAYGTQGEKLFFTPAGLQALQTIAETGSKPTQATSQAVAYMLSLLEAEQAGQKEQQNGNAQP